MINPVDQQREKMMARPQSQIMKLVQAAVTAKSKKQRMKAADAAEHFGVPVNSIYRRDWYKKWRDAQKEQSK